MFSAQVKQEGGEYECGYRIWFQRLSGDSNGVDTRTAAFFCSYAKADLERLPQSQDLIRLGLRFGL